MQARKVPFGQWLRALALLLAAAHFAVAKTPGEVPVGAPLGDVSLRGLNGPPLRLSALRGRPLLINVWASWCGPCKLEMASLERLSWTEPYFSIIGISTDDDAERAQVLLAATHASISHYLDHDLQMETLLGASVLPVTVLIDAQGRVLKRIYGAKQWDGPEARRLIDEAFRHKAAAR